MVVITLKYFLKFQSYNIEGLSDKLSNQDLLSEISKYDFVTLVETWLPDGFNINIPGFYSFTKGRTKHKKAKRHSGGMTDLVKKEIKQGVKFFSSSSTRFVLWKLDRQFPNLDQDIYACSTYIPPANSVYIKNGSEGPFSELEKSIAKYSMLGEIILMSDFNARKGKLNDDIECNFNQHILDEEDRHLVSHKLLILNSRDTANPNKFGRLLVKLCSSNNLCILHGRSKGDAKGEFTCFNYKESSVIDYGIVSNSLFQKVVYFKVHKLSFTSSHCPVSFAIRTKRFKTNKHDEDFLGKKPPKYVWVPNQAVKFKEILNKKEVVSAAANLVTHYLSNENEETESKINKIICGITEIIKDTASKCFNIKEGRKYKGKEKKEKKEKRFDRSLSEMKSNWKGQPTSWGNIQKTLLLGGRYFATKKSFKKLVRQKEFDFRSNILKQISVMESNNPNKFWNMVNELRTTKKNNYINNIEPAKWYSWFKELNKAFDKDIRSIVKNLKLFTAGNSNTLLDGPVTIPEIKRAAKKLKNSKACGEDLINNEMIKCIVQTKFRGIILWIFNIILDKSLFPHIWKIEYIVPIFRIHSTQVITEELLLQVVWENYSL